MTSWEQTDRRAAMLPHLPIQAPGARWSESIRRSAFHEGGHAVVAHLLGYQVLGISIRHIESRAGHTVYAGLPTSPRRLGPEGPALSSDEAGIVVSLGGPVAEDEATGHDAAATLESAREDLLHVRELAARAFPHQVEQSIRLFYERVRAWLLVPERWRLVEAVATALIKCHVLTRPDLLRILEGETQAQTGTPWAQLTWDPLYKVRHILEAQMLRADAECRDALIAAGVPDARSRHLAHAGDFRRAACQQRLKFPIRPNAAGDPIRLEVAIVPPGEPAPASDDPAWHLGARGLPVNGVLAVESLPGGVTVYGRARYEPSHRLPTAWAVWPAGHLMPEPKFEFQITRDVT